MKYTVSLICNLSEHEINKYINTDAFEVTPIHRAANECSAQSSLYGVNYPIFRNKYTVDLALSQLEWCKNIPNVVLGSPALRNDNNPQAVDYFFRRYKKLYSNTLAIEPLHPSYGTTFCNTLDEAQALAKKYDIKINLDLGSCAIEHEDISKLDVSYINHVHVSGAHLSSKIDIKYCVECLRHLKAHGYDKYVSLETLDFYRDIDDYLTIIREST